MFLIIVLIVLAIAVVAGFLLWLVLVRSQPSALEDLGVKLTYPRTSVLPVPKIEAYCEAKQQLRMQYARNSTDDRWMADLPGPQKEILKYRLMQRAIGDMASLQKIDTDARGYWRLFCKGIITRTFWQSVVDIEKELSQELENVKLEAQFIEPRQDPMGIIQEAMHFITRYGDKLPSATEIAQSAEAITDMMRQLPPGQHPPMPGMPGMPGLPGLPGMPGMPPGMRPPGAPGEPPAQQQLGGGNQDCNWRQDADEIEVTICVPNGATKGDVKVVIQPQALKVLHKGEVVAEGKLAGGCKPDGSTWTMSKGGVVITLEKAAPRPWPSLFKDAP
jgi:hypothetical protein